MNEQDNFKALMKFAVDNRSDTPPESAQEFDIYCDEHYNLYMFIKGDWVNIGINVTPV